MDRPRIGYGELFSPVGLDDSRRWVVAIGAWLVLRLAYAAIWPVGLVGDEAYYWDWGRHLDWGYFSKPPMIAWIMAFADRVLGGSVFSIRAVAAVLGTISTLLVALLARDVYGRHAAFWAAAIFVASPGNFVLHLILTVDAPLVLCWTAALVGGRRLLASNGRSLAAAAGTCVAVGAGLLSKQMMLAFYPIAALVAAVTPAFRGTLRRPAFWIGWAASHAFLVPTLLWNHAHGWITLEHTAHHFDPSSSGVGATIARAFEYVAGQMGLVSPIVWVLLVTVVAVVLAAPGRFGPNERFLAAYAGLGLVVTFAMTTRQRINPNWPAVYYVSGTVLLAGWGVNAWGTGVRVDRWRRALAPGVWVGAALAAFTAALPFAIAATPWVGSEADPTARLRGWGALAAEVDRYRSTGERRDALVVTVGHRDLASQLAYHLTDRPRVYRFAEPGVVVSQYEIWGPPSGATGRDAVIVVDEGRALPPALGEAFVRIEPLGEATARIGPSIERRVSVYRAERLRHWPGAGRTSTHAGEVNR